jgi:tetratricopeptide (TPR) repeat protein
MKFSLFLLLFLFVNLFSFAQPDHIKRLMEKMQTGKELTEAEEQAMVKWAESMDKDPNVPKKPAAPDAKKANISGTAGLCPKVLPAKPTITPLTTETYVSLAKSLMASYGPKMGVEIAMLDKQLGSGKPTGGADLGAMYSMIGAGSATIYATAWSAVKIPADVLTANNLGVALKGMGEFTTAIQVLLYAYKLKPNVPLISINLGWAYREMGDPFNAKLMFERALQLAPDLPSPQLGLGLIAECEGNHAKALQLLRKALAGRYSAAGIAAYKQAKAAQSNIKSGNQNQSVATEKGETKEFDIPELPVFDSKGKMEQAGAILNNYSEKLDSRIGALQELYLSLGKIVSQQSAKANQNPDNSIVFSRDFSKELFMLQDIYELLWGESSNWAKKVDEAKNLLAKIHAMVEQDAPIMLQMTEKGVQLNLEAIQLQELLNKEVEACGTNDLCIKKAEAKYNKAMAPITTEMDQLEFRICKLSKSEMDVSFANACKAWKIVSDELKSNSLDYYAFTNPIVEKIYAPSLNELQNVYRELVVLSAQKYVLGIASGLPDDVKSYNELKCVEPEPPQAASTVKDPKLPKIEKAPCPLGEQGFNFGLGGISFKLNCERAEISGGEGFLWSAKRDFGKQQTIVWGAVGAKAEYGYGNLTGEASVGVEVTIGKGAVQDVALTSSVKAGLGGLVEGEVSGRLSLEDGASIEGTGEFVPPGIQDILVSPNTGE